jgi:hypothetical protein
VDDATSRVRPRARVVMVRFMGVPVELVITTMTTTTTRRAQ